MASSDNQILCRRCLEMKDDNQFVTCRWSPLNECFKGLCYDCYTKEYGLTPVAQEAKDAERQFVRMGIWILIILAILFISTSLILKYKPLIFGEISSCPMTLALYHPNP